jgi:hypothetical protein
LVQFVNLLNWTFVIHLLTKEFWMKTIYFKYSCSNYRLK